MNKIRVSKIFYFEAAHALYGHNGACKNIHGHSYSLTVTIIGTANKKPNCPDDGMVIDYAELKNIINATVIKKFDHSLILNGESPHIGIKAVDTIFNNILLVNYQPTCENLLLDFVKKIKPVLPKNVSIHHLRLKETDTSYAEWYAEDN